MTKKLNLHHYLSVFLRIVLEVVIIHLAFFLGYHIYMHGFDIQLYSQACLELNANLYYLPAYSNHYFTVAIGLSVTTFVTFAYLRLYSHDSSLLNVKEYRKVIIGFVFSVIIFLALYYVFFAYTCDSPRSKLFSRRILAYALSIGLFLIICERAVFNFVIKKLHNKGRFVDRILIYGAGEIGKLTARRLFQFPAIGLWPVGFIDDNSELLNKDIVYDLALNKSLKVLSNKEGLNQLLQSMDVEEVIIAMPSISVQDTVSIFNLCKTHKIPFRFVPNIYELAVQKTKTDEIMGLPIIRLKIFQSSLFYQFFKRGLDLVVASLMLIFMSPIFLVISILIKKDSPGPVFFVQKRVGLNGAIFNMVKFRSMFSAQNGDEVTPDSISDPRITRFGRFLRKSSLDELPQLFNVLTGAMSLVGPRPEMVFIVDQYEEIHRERLKVKPGITGLWQISADRKLAIHENLDYDLYYIHERSILIDLIILVQTVFFAFKGI